MKRRNNLIFALIFAMLCICSVSSNAQPLIEKPISVPDLKQIIRTEDESGIIRAMNRVKQNQESYELMTFIVALWNNDQKELADLPWPILNSEVIRIEIANVLVQASNNGYVKINREELRKYSKQVIAGSNEKAKATAVSTLGLIKNSGDIEMLKHVALEENPQTFWAAIIALSENCDARASVALKDIKGRVSHSESIKFLQDSSETLKEYRYGCDTRK
jgi:hypothetical protein